MKINVFDLETNGLLTQATKLNCIVTLDVETELVSAYHDTTLYPRHGSLERGMEELLDSDCLIGHNITGYDIPLLHHLYPNYSFRNHLLLDTQKICELLHPEIKKQSIENWVEILKLPDPKIQIADWSHLTQLMLDRCVGDVKNNLALYKYLKDRKAKEENGVPIFKKAIETEQEVSLIHAQQVFHGVMYNVELAKETAREFTEKMDVIADKVSAEAPPIMNIPSLSDEKQKELKVLSKSATFSHHLEGVSPFKNLKWKKGVPVNPFTMKMQYTAQVKAIFGDDYEQVKGEFCRVSFDPDEVFNSLSLAWFGPEYIWKVKGPYNKIEFHKLNVSSDNQVKDYLLSLGWIPIEYNYSKKTNERTSPKLTEESYVSLPPGLGQDIAEYRILQHRRNLIITSKEDGGALNLVRLDGRIEADAFTCGTPTARYRHTGVCNIPRPGTKYGERIRKLYGVAKGHLQIGIDLSGIEARMLTNFCWEFAGGPEFAALVLEGDWHSANAELWGCSRNDAKTELYALAMAHVKLIEIREHLREKSYDNPEGSPVNARETCNDYPEREYTQASGSGELR